MKQWWRDTETFPFSQNSFSLAEHAYATVDRDAAILSELHTQQHIALYNELINVRDTEHVPFWKEEKKGQCEEHEYNICLHRQNKQELSRKVSRIKKSYWYAQQWVLLSPGVWEWPTGDTSNRRSTLLVSGGESTADRNAINPAGDEHNSNASWIIQQLFVRSLLICVQVMRF